MNYKAELQLSHHSHDQCDNTFKDNLHTTNYVTKILQPFWLPWCGLKQPTVELWRERVAQRESVIMPLSYQTVYQGIIVMH